MSALRGTLVLAPLVLIAGCATPMTAGADFDSNVEFRTYNTFAWAEPDGLPTGDPRLDENPFFTERLHNAIQVQFDRRGVSPNEDSPKLLVHHHTSVRTHVEIYNADADLGYTSEEYGPGTQVVEYEEGTFLVDIADADTKEILWRGWAVADVDRALNDPELMAEILDKAVALMFERFPVEPIGP